MTQKTKKYEGVKFPYQVISDASKVFHSLSPKGKKEMQKRWSIEKSDVTWDYENEDQFRSEYARDEVIFANAIFMTLQSTFTIHLSAKYEFVTTISVKFSSIDKIEKVFSVFDAYYEKNPPPIKEKNKDLEEIKKNLEAIQATYEETIRKDKETELEKPLPYYRLESIIPSTFPDKDALTSLEKYILQRVGQLVDEKELRPYQKSKYSATIFDSSGTLSLSSIVSIPQDVFDNDTRFIELKYAGSYSTLEILVNFTQQRDSSKLKISYKGENAREIAESVKSGIFKVLNEYKTNNSLYHSPLLLTFLGFQAIVCGTLAFYSLLGGSTNVSLLGGVALFDLIFLFVATPLKPYTVFDTRKNRSIMGWNKWLIEAILASLLGWLIFSFLVPSVFP